MQLYQRYQHFVIIVVAVQNSKCNPSAEVPSCFSSVACSKQAASHRLDSSLPSTLCLQSVFTIRTSRHCVGTFLVAIFPSDWISRLVLERNTLFVRLYSLFPCNYVMSHYVTSPTPNSVLFIFRLAVHGSGSWSQGCHLVRPGSILGRYMFDLWRTKWHWHGRLSKCRTSAVLC